LHLLLLSWQREILQSLTVPVLLSPQPVQWIVRALKLGSWLEIKSGACQIKQKEKSESKSTVEHCESLNSSCISKCRLPI
jgi:hypothetical protein